MAFDRSIATRPEQRFFVLYAGPQIRTTLFRKNWTSAAFFKAKTSDGAHRMAAKKEKTTKQKKLTPADERWLKEWDWLPAQGSEVGFRTPVQAWREKLSLAARPRGTVIRYEPGLKDGTPVICIEVAEGTPRVHMARVLLEPDAARALRRLKPPR